MTDRIIYSANEAATNDGAGFWSNEDGWVDCASEATRFEQSAMELADLPMSTGQDAKWCLLSDFVS